jgi:hypothetical protein
MVRWQSPAVLKELLECIPAYADADIVSHIDPFSNLTACHSKEAVRGIFLDAASDEFTLELNI